MGYVARSVTDAADLWRPALAALGGWADSSAEVDQGIWAVAAPVPGGQGRLHAISVALPEYRLDPGRREALRTAFLASAAELQEKIACYG